jgi:predicted mannosyl-3-phosphoglycerate phosphatase (HAD superfamily)
MIRHLSAPAPSPVARSARLVVVTRADDVVSAQTRPCASADTVGVLSALEVPLILVSASNSADVREWQRQLGISAPFICGNGAALCVPPGYFLDVTYHGVSDDRQDAWEIFRFNPPDSAAAVRLLCSLFAARGDEVLTVGLGCDQADYGLLTTVDVPIVVRDDCRDQERLLRGVPGAYLTHASGVDGWSEALLGVPSP